MVALANRGLPACIDGARLDGTINDTSNVSFVSSMSSNTTGNNTDAIVEFAIKVAIRGSDTKSTPLPLRNNNKYFS